VGSAGCSPGCFKQWRREKIFGLFESGSDVFNGQDCIEVPVFAAWIAPDEHVKKSSLTSRVQEASRLGENPSEDEKYAIDRMR
jgi:hypothetical protein